ncbi:MAG: hypothetical protein IT442_12090, partial [Phycisphaeraceae bacterium]|nr:hypothetical protein [Phycisphaeraceae bacterium]
MFDRSDRPQISLSLNDQQTCLESLEPRLLLSTLFGGETFEFQDAQQQRIIVSVGGNVVVEVIGGTVSINDNTVILHQMPGDIWTSSIGRGGIRLNGGFAGQKGSDPVTLDSLNGAPISYSAPGGLGGGGGPVFGNNLSVNALASNAEGDTYGFNFYEPSGGLGAPTVHLFRFVNHGSTGAVESQVADLGPRIRALVFGGTPPEDNPPEVRGVDAAAFNPIDGRLYFVATVNRPDLPNSPQGLEYVLSIDVSGNLLTASSTMRKVDNDGLFGDTIGEQQLQVHSIAFDQVLDTPGDYGTSSISGGAPSSYMWAYYTLTLPNIGERAVLAKYEVYDDGVIGPPRIDTNAPIRSTFLQIGTGVNAQPLLSIRGIDFNSFNPALEESGIFAITNEGNASSMLYLAFDPTAVNSLVVTINNFGTVFDPDDPDFTPTAADAAFNDQQIRGESPGSLTWNPVLVNPYTGRQGVFLFADTETDDLMFVSELQRFGQANAFFIYVTQGDPNGYITFSVETLDEATGIRTITPYDGSLQEMRVIGLSAGDFITVNASGVGGAMLGAVTLDLNPDNPEDDLIPLLQASLSGSRLDDFYGSLGTLPAGLETITPGLVVARSLLSYYQPGISIADRLLKQNMDLVEGMSASGDGRTLALIDTDAKSLFGFAYTTPGDDLAFYDTVTRTLTTPVRVFYNVNPPGPDTVTYLPRVQGLDYGGGFFGEKLFAIYDLDTTAATDLRLGTIAATGEFSPVAGGGQLDTSIVAVQAMAFTPDQTQLYIIGLNVLDEARLYRYDIDPDTGAMSNFQTIGRLVDAATGEMPTNFGSMDFTGNTVGGLPQLLAHDRHNGRLVDISLTPVGVHVLVGANVATDKGSLRPAVGAITYDRLNNRMFAVDNTFGQMPLADENSTRTTAFVNGQLVVTHEAVDESAALMVLTGLTSTSARPQDLGRFLFGGSVTGAVSISGSMQTFYAGWIILGDAAGQNDYYSPQFPGNFYVGGDLLNLITAYNAGGLLADTDSTRDLQRVIYDTGLDIVVNGRLGQVRATGDFLGSVQVRNAVAPGELDFRYTSTPEIEVRTWALSEEVANAIVGGEWLGGNQVWNNQISETDFLLNDVNPQFLGALPLTTLGANTNIVRGNLSWNAIASPDLADYYAVALMGGQTLSLQLATGELQVYLFDPDGNVVASNYSRVSDGTHQVFAYKATRPGVYRIGVFMLGDLNHTGAINDDINPVALVDENYELRVTSLGNLAFGGLSAVRHIYSMDGSSPAFEVDHGDLGALWAGDGLLLPAVSTGSIFFYGGADPLFSNIPGMSTIRVRSGDLRAIVGSSIGLDDAIEPGAEGFNQTDDFLNDPEIEVWSGNIGLIRSAAFMAIDIGTLTFIEDATDPSTRAVLAALDIRPIGGNIQFIDAGYSIETNAIFWGNIRVNGSIGVFRADNVGMATYPASVSSLVSTSFEINASGTTAGAVLDMIDVRGNWGDFQDGGIPLSIGGGGNIRFIKVGGFAYNDRFYGAPGSSEASYDIDPNDPDKWLRDPVRIVDDGGAVFYVAPLRDVANPGYDPVASPDIEPSMPNFVIIRALGVRHSGGVVVTSIQAGDVGVVPEIGINNIAMPIVGGVAVWGVSGRAAEIGQIYIDPTARGGSGVPTDNPGGANETQWTVNVLLHGSVALDVYDISSNPNVVFNRIRNESGYRGEDGVFVGGNFFNGLVEGVGELYAAGNIGVATGSTGADLGSTRILVQQIPAYQDQDPDTLYPLGLRDTGWVVVRADGGPATVGRIAAGRAMANLLIAGDVREIIADEDHSFRSDDDIYEGIAGPIWVTNIAHTHPSPGNYVILGTLGTLDIGEGIAPIGSGMVGGGAVVVGDTDQEDTGMVGRIDVVRNRGLGSDIAGAIVTTGEIGRITIDDGALIGARIFTRLSIHYMAAEPLSYLVPIFGEAVGNIETDIELGSLQINGRGGIIGSYIGGTDMGPISVRGGFGIIHSVIEMGTWGSLASLYVDGYGLRDSRIIGGERIGDITLGGRGQSIAASPLIFTPSVFQSELGVNPFGQAISVYSDLHAYLGTSAATREIAGVTDTGVIEDSVVKSARYLANVRAYQIRTRGGTEEPSGLTSFQIAVSIESIQTLSDIDGLSIVTGGIKKFQPASDVSRLHLTVSGPIQSIVIRGSLMGDSVISSTGPDGFINQIKVSGDMSGSIESASRINSIQIGGDLAGDITIHGIGLTSRAYALGSLTLGGSLLDGSLRIVGNVNQIRIAGGMGLAGEELRILGDLKSLTVGTDRSITTASMDLDLIVDGDLSTLNVNGPINGQVLVGGTLGSLILTNRTGSPIDLIAAPIAVHGDLKTVRLTDGALAADLSVGGDLNSLSVRNADVSANVTAGGNINRFDLSAGSILADATVTSSLGDIKNLSISGGDLLGQVRA